MKERDEKTGEWKKDVKTGKQKFVLEDAKSWSYTPTSGLVLDLTIYELFLVNVGLMVLDPERLGLRGDAIV